MSTKTFDASRYLSDLNGRDYLEVKWRLLWLRTEHPEAVVETELIKHDDGLALFQARVSVPDGGSATGWGSETAGDFGDYIEKAETKALGRALAALGYGTQFCEDFDFSADRQAKSESAKAPRSSKPTARNGQANSTEARVVDTPVKAPEGTPRTERRGLSVVRDRGEQAATPSQLNAIYAIGREQTGADGSVEERCRAVFDRGPGELTKRQASEFIDQLRAGRNGAKRREEPAPV